MSKTDNAIKWFELSREVQKRATAAMIKENGKKRLGDKYLREMDDRLVYYDMAIRLLKITQFWRKLLFWKKSEESK